MVGVLKNRLRDGRHCWVQTSMTPILEGEHVVAYRAVHTTAQRDRVRAAEALYAMLLPEQRPGRQAHHLQAGAIVRKDMVGRLSRFVRPKRWARSGFDARDGGQFLRAHT